MEQKSIVDALANFVTNVDGVYASAPISVLALRLISTGMDAFAFDTIKGFINPDEPGKLVVPRSSHSAVLKASRRRTTASLSVRFAPRTFLVSMVSQFDVFLSQLLTGAFGLCPDLINASDRKLSFSELSEFGSIEDARESIIDAEIDAFLRKSLTEQFQWLESKFDLKLRVDLAAWPLLVELTQRRNLFVHADGVISKQYLDVCQSNGVDVTSQKIGDQLSANPEYLRVARDTLIEVGVKLAQVLWRKLDKDASIPADEQLNELCFSLLQDKRYKLAGKLLDFAFLKPMKHTSKPAELMLLVNRANAHLLMGNEQMCAQIVGADDWSAYEPQFRLARAVLLRDLETMSKVIEEIGSDSSPDQFNYKEWPLFDSVRDTPEFREAYLKAFGEEVTADAKQTDKADPSTSASLTAAELAKGLVEMCTQDDEMKQWLQAAVAAFR